MALRFTNPRGSFPPGGFEFVDPKTGMRFDGMSADLTLQAQNVAKHRRANPRIYPSVIDVAAIVQEITNYTCARLPHLCQDSDQPFQTVKALIKRPAVKIPAGKKCLQCSSDNLDPVWCRSCAGSKLTGYKCNNCGAAVSK